MLELAWWTGARAAAIRGLDRGDVDLEAGTVAFHHRPETDTHIKPAYNQERIVGLPSAAVDVLREYIDHVRHPDTFDEHHREPLLTTTKGRMSEGTFQRYAYWTSLPCHGRPCPHDRERSSCAWFSLRDAHSCPSAHGPHSIRTGAISNLINEWGSLTAVAERVNTSPATLKKHYDFPTMDEQYQERRAGLVDELGLDADGLTDDQEADSDAT